MILLLPAVACFVGALLLIGTVVLAPRRAVRASLLRVAAHGRPAPEAAAAVPRRAPLVGALARLALRLSPRSSREKVAGMLHAAGLAGRISPESYLAGKAVSVIVGVVLGALLGGAGGGVGRVVLLAPLFGLAGLLAPDTVLVRLARSRRDRILTSLPNALDLLAVSVEAGLGLDGAIARYAETARGPLADELARVVRELRVGASRQEVLNRLADRIAAPETTAFVRAVTRADQLGVSLASTLRGQAAETRRRRQTFAEEAANKAPVKMLFPTVFLVFPALFVIVLGPAVLFMMDTFR